MFDYPNAKINEAPVIMHRDKAGCNRAVALLSLPILIIHWNGVVQELDMKFLLILKYFLIYELYVVGVAQLFPHSKQIPGSVPGHKQCNILQTKQRRVYNLNDFKKSDYVKR